MAFKMKHSPFRKTEGGPKGDKKKNIKKSTVNAARQLLKDAGVNNPNLSDDEVLNAAKVKKVYGEARSQALSGYKEDSTRYVFKSDKF